MTTRKQSMPVCLVCCHAIDNVSRFNTTGVCGHTGCCSVCSLRMRELLGNCTCPICKADLPRVICIESDQETFDSYQDWGDNIGPTHVFDESSGIFFLKADYLNICKLREHYCRKCDKKFGSLNALKTHLMNVHSLQYCSICLEHKKVFLQEQELFTKDQLKKHSTKGNPREGFAGHPRCDFCCTRYYSNAELYDHLHKNHFECHICLRSLDIQNRYYKDYHDLENHFRADHFLCEERSCLEKKFVVFKSHLDYQAHMTKEHPYVKISKKIDVHFTIRRANRDGSGGVLGDQGSGGNDGAFEDYGQFLQAPERQHYSSAQDDHTINVADFPSLTSDGAARSEPLTFWENQSVSAPRMEDFPELSSRNMGAASANASSFRNALAPPPTPAMLAHMQRGNEWEYPELATAAAALGANNPLMRFVKPAKMKRKKGKGSGGNNGGARAQTPYHEEREEKAEEVVYDDEEEAQGSKSAIVLKIRQVLGSDAKYEVFREACRDYRLKELDVASFYANVRPMFSEPDFGTLFVQLMKLAPDKNQVQEFLTFHRQQQQGKSDGFQAPKPSKKKSPPKKSTAPAARRPAASGWANALRQSGIAAAPAPKASLSVVMPANKKKQPELNTTRWSSAESWQAPASAAAPAVGLTPSSTKIQTAPADAMMANLRIHSAADVVSTAASSTSSSSSSFRTTKSDFPELPRASKPIGRESVTRATWDDQLQAIAHHRNQQETAAPTGKRKQKKKAMTLGEMAMKFQ